MKKAQLRALREGHNTGINQEAVGKFFTRGEVRYSTHTHAEEHYIASDGRLEAKGVQPPCEHCEKENQAFDSLLYKRNKGATWLESRIMSLESAKVYESRYPFDSAEMVLSIDGIIEMDETDHSVPVAKNADILGTIIDNENVHEFLADLPEEQRDIILRTVEGFKPREIAKQRGEKTSARVRQDKYAAMRTLGAPINRKMRRVK